MGASVRRGRASALLMVLLVALVACGEDGPDSVAEVAREPFAGLPDGSPEARFLPDPPLFGVRMAAGINGDGLVGPAFSFDATVPQVVAVVALGEVPEGATLTVAWARLDGIDDLEPLFSQEIAVGPFARAYSVGVSGGRLAAGWYEVSAVLGEQEVATRWRVADAEGVAQAFQLVSTSPTESVPGQPPDPGDSGVWVDFFDAEAGTWVPRHFDEFPWHLDPATGEPWAEDPRDPREPREPQPCALESMLGGYEFFHVTVDVYLRSNLDCDQEIIDGITIVAAIVGSPVPVGTGRRADFPPCGLPGGTDKPGTIVHVVASLPGQEADSVAIEVEIEDLEALVAGLASDPKPGSRVEPGQAIRLQAMAMELFQGSGIRSLEIHGPGGVLHAEEHDPADCDPVRHLKIVTTTYTVPSDPPPVIELRAVVEDHAGRQDSDTITLVTEDIEHWSGTFTSENTGSSCSGSAEGAVQLSVEGGAVTGSIDGAEAGSCDGIAYAHAGTFGLRGTFDGAAFLLDGNPTSATAMASWVCFWTDPAPAVTVGPPGTASAEWTFSGEHDTYRCSLTLQRQDGPG